MKQAFSHHYPSLSNSNKSKHSRYEKKPRYGKVMIPTEEERESENISMLHMENSTDISELALELKANGLMLHLS